MLCFNCGQMCRTEYPRLDNVQYVRKKCDTCGWKSYPIAVVKNK
jgi:predicted RNA-binding Zn-ribbon protein involved in translation (DUF1610 family)